MLWVESTNKSSLALHWKKAKWWVSPNSPNIGQTNFDDSYKMVKLNDSKT
jgi:hypothetical protein